MNELLVSLELIRSDPSASIDVLEAGFRRAREAEALGLIAIRYEHSNPPTPQEIERYDELGEDLFNRFKEIKSSISD